MPSVRPVAVAVVALLGVVLVVQLGLESSHPSLYTWIYQSRQLITTTGMVGQSTVPFCQSWSASDANNRSLQPYDEWFTHHPDMIVNNETDDEFCVELQDGDDETKAYVR